MEIISDKVVQKFENWRSGILLRKIFFQKRFCSDRISFFPVTTGQQSLFIIEVLFTTFKFI